MIVFTSSRNHHYRQSQMKMMMMTTSRRQWYYSTNHIFSTAVVTARSTCVAIVVVVVVVIIMIEQWMIHPSSVVNSFVVIPSYISIYKTTKSSTVPVRFNSKTVMIEYIGEDMWDDEFITEQISFVPDVQIVQQMPAPLTAFNNNNTSSCSGSSSCSSSSSSSSSSSCYNCYYLLRHGQSTANVAEVISSDRFTLSYTNKHGLTELGTQQAKQSAQQLFHLLLKQQQVLLLQQNPNNNNSNNNHHHHHRILFVTSPFARARQTALACLHGIQEIVNGETTSNSHASQQQQQQQQQRFEVVPTIVVNNLLVERFFGTFDADELYTYGYVWPLDQHNVTHTTYNVESVAAVATRIQLLMEQINDYIQTTYPESTTATTTTDSTTTTATVDVADTTSGVMNHIVLVSHGDVVQIAQLYAANVTNVGEFSSYRFQNGEIRPMLINDTSALPTPIPLEQPKKRITYVNR